jgi:esterase/lipase superfamily enzyme/TPR repeat protein
MRIWFTAFALYILTASSSQAQPAMTAMPADLLQGYSGLKALGTNDVPFRIRQLGDQPLTFALPVEEDLDPATLQLLTEGAMQRFSFNAEEAVQGEITLLELANSGVIAAEYLLGLPTDSSNWTIEQHQADFARNLEFANQNDPLAQRLVATGFIKGDFVTPDLSAARSNLESLVENPRFDTLEPTAQIEVLRLSAEVARFGVAGEPDEAQAEQIWQAGIDRGDVLSKLGLSDLLLTSEGEGDRQRGLALLGEAAEAGNTFATIKALNLSQEAEGFFRVDDLFGQLRQKSTEDPFAAAAAGDYLLQQPEVTDDMVSEALSYYQLDLDNRPLSQLRLGDYLLGLEGNPAANEQGLALLRKSADSGVADALMSLAEVESRSNFDAPLVAYNAAMTASADNPHLEQRSIAIALETCIKITCSPVPVLFVTDREIIENGPDIDFANAPSPDGKLRFGIAHVAIPIPAVESERILQEIFDTYGAGGGNWVAENDPARAELLAQTEWQKYPVRLMLSEDDVTGFIARAHDQVADQTDRAMVFVHGFNTTFYDAIRRAAVTAERSRFPGVPIVLSWSSAANAFAFPSDILAADLACASFRPVMMAISNTFGASNVSLIMHSAGNALGLSMFGACAEGADLGVGPEDDLIGLGVFAAPAVPAGRFTQQFPAVGAHIWHSTLYVSQYDIPLRTGQVLYNGRFLNVFNERMAGTGGNGSIVMPNLHTIDASAVEEEGVAYGSSLGHSYVFDRTQVADDLSQLLWGETARDRRRCLADTSAGAWSVVQRKCKDP